MTCCGVGVGDPREAAQIAEPQHRVDAIGDAAHDPPAEHALAGIAAEIGFHQGAGHPRQRDGLDGKREKRHEALERGDMRIVEAARRPAHPGRIDAVHVADHALRREAIDDRDVVGHADRAQLRKHAELGLASPLTGGGATAIRRSATSGRMGCAATGRHSQLAVQSVDQHRCQRQIVRAPRSRSCGRTRPSARHRDRGPSGIGGLREPDEARRSGYGHVPAAGPPPPRVRTSRLRWQSRLPRRDRHRSTQSVNCLN